MSKKLVESLDFLCFPPLAQLKFFYIKINYFFSGVGETQKYFGSMMKKCYSGNLPLKRHENVCVDFLKNEPTEAHRMPNKFKNMVSRGAQNVQKMSLLGFGRAGSTSFSCRILGYGGEHLKFWENFR